MENENEEEVEVSGCGTSVSYNQLPPLFAKYPWFIVQNLEDLTDQIFYTFHNPLLKYQCRIPELSGKCIRGCFHGWIILSNHPHNNIWSLWNPSTSNVISLPPLGSEYKYVGHCCLSAPPDDPCSVLLFTRTDKSTFVFCHLFSKRNERLRKLLRWTETSYAEQIKRITLDGDLLHSLTCCNGKVFALCTDNTITKFVIQVEIVVKDREVVVQLVLFGSAPFEHSRRCFKWAGFLIGSCTELFYITVGFLTEAHETPDDVYLYKLDTTSINWEELKGLEKWDMTGWTWDESEEEFFDDLGITEVMWKQMKDLKDAIFFVDLGRNKSIFYNPSAASELGGYIYIRDKMDNIIYSYNLDYTTIVPSLMPSPVLSTSHVSMWDCSLCRLEDDHAEVKCMVDTKQEKGEIVARSFTNDEVGFNESPFLNLPSDILETIMEFCVCVEYMNFRATCKRCHLAAPVIRWSNKNKTSLRRLQKYSLVSPWLMVVEKHREFITFTDPMSGDNYFIKRAGISIFDDTIHCSRYGWLLFKTSDICVVFYNPFTGDFLELPEPDYRIYGLAFSAPPTSPDCMVVGFALPFVHIYYVNRREQTWRIFHLGDTPRLLNISFPTFCGRDLYALCKERDVIVFKDLGKENPSCKLFEAKVPTSICRSRAKYFLAKCDQNILVVVVGGFGEPIEVFKMNDSTKKWRKVINGIGKHMICICDTTCLCIEAKTPEMENKIYLAQLSSGNKKIVFYSLETCMYYTFNGKSIQENLLGDFFTTAYLSAHAWIEPNWSPRRRPKRSRVSE